MSEGDRYVTVHVSTELLAELGDWSPPVQVKITETPGYGTGYEMTGRTLPGYRVRINGEWVALDPRDVEVVTAVDAP